MADFPWDYLPLFILFIFNNSKITFVAIGSYEQLEYKMATPNPEQ